MRLNPWFNAVIGGRGSGKSTLLECLRIGLNRSGELDDLRELKSQFEKFRKVSSGGNSEGVFLEESELEVEYSKDDAAYRMHWRGGDSAPLLMERAGNDWREAGEVISSRFPAHIYSQKQVFEMARNPHTLRRLMDEDPSLDKIGWKQEWDELEARFLNLRADYRRLGKELAERERIEGERRDVQRKLWVFEQSHHADVLKAFQQSQCQQTLVDRLKDLDAKQRQQVELGLQYRTIYGELKSLRLQLTERRRNFVATVLGQNRHVKVDLISFGDRWRAEEDFRALIGKPRPTYANDTLDEDGERGFIHDLYMTEEG